MRIASLVVSIISLCVVEGLAFGLDDTELAIIREQKHEEARILWGQDDDKNEDPGHTGCPGVLRPYCCDELDYSGYEVECIGPGMVDYLEKCLEFEPRPMCCCALDQEVHEPDGPPYHFPRFLTCDKDCTVLDGEH